MKKRFFLVDSKELSKTNQELIEQIRQRIRSSPKLKPGMAVVALAHSGKTLDIFGVKSGDITKIIKGAPLIESEVNKILTGPECALVIVIEGANKYDYVVIEPIAPAASELRSGG